MSSTSLFFNTYKECVFTGLKDKSLFHMQQKKVFGPGVLPDYGVQGGGGDLSRRTVERVYCRAGALQNNADYYCLAILHKSQLRKHCGIELAGVRKIALRILKLLYFMLAGLWSLDTV